MCRAGVITEAQLEHALSVQGVSGRPLGEVIVRLGYASPGAVANALAEQYGRMLRTEDGLSTGPGAGVRERFAAESPEVPGQADAPGRPPAEPAGAPRELVPPSPQLEPEDAHLLFVPSPAGYSLVRRAGPCPERGSRVDVDGRRYTVARSGGSPLGNRLRCAYLEPGA